MKPITRFESELIIRRGENKDTGLLADLGARTFSETFAVDNTPENMAAYLAAAFTSQQLSGDLADPRCVFLIAESYGVAVGYGMLRTGAAPEQVTGERPIELVRLYVSRDSLGSGVGAALMQACIDEAKRSGQQTLWLGVWEHNHRAQSFYRKWHFHEMGTHRFQLGDDPQTDLLMQRCINTPKEQ
ncbi:MAG: GNAT family N-acetyltransferase [Pyrinomonadaceae bacterium]